LSKHENGKVECTDVLRTSQRVSDDLQQKRSGKSAVWQTSSVERRLAMNVLSHTRISSAFMGARLTPICPVSNACDAHQGFGIGTHDSSRMQERANLQLLITAIADVLEFDPAIQIVLAADGAEARRGPDLIHAGARERALHVRDDRHAREFF
jgi:hypothetical protein